MMAFDRLPERRYERRVVIVVDLPTQYALREDQEAVALSRREDVALLYAGTDLDTTDDVTRSLERQGLLVPGTVLVASPYRDGDYASIDEAAQRFGLQKWAAISTLCGLLGARTVDVKVVEDSISNTKVDVSIGGDRGPAQVHGSGKSSSLEKFAGQLTWHDEFLGGVADLELAREHLNATGLEADPEVRSLVDARAHTGNTLLRRTVAINLSRESERVIGAALSLKVPAVLKVDGTFSRAAQTRASYQVQIEIDFGQESR
jgi:hypothetical protein